MVLTRDLNCATPLQGRLAKLSRKIKELFTGDNWKRVLKRIQVQACVRVVGRRQNGAVHSTGGNLVQDLAATVAVGEPEGREV